MIHKIAELLRDQISGLSFVEIAAGLAKPVIVRVNNTSKDADEPAMIDKAVPMAYNDLGLECEEGDIYPLTPNTKKKSIHFWEDGGTELVSEDTYYYHNRSRLTLVSWWNLPLIDETLHDPSSLVANLIAEMPRRIANTDYITMIRVSFEGESPSLADIVSKYTLDEAENQFATWPYFYTALEFSVEWAFPINCISKAFIIPAECPPKQRVVHGLLDFDGVDDYVVLDNLVTQVTGTASVKFNCVIPSEQDFSDPQVLLSFTNAAFTDGIIVWLYSDVGGGNARMIISVENAGINTRMFTLTDSMLDIKLSIVIAKTAGAVTSVTVNGVAQTIVFSVDGVVALSNKHIGCRFFATALEFFNGLIWDIGFGSDVYWKGYPEGNTDAAWEDQIGTNDGTVNGNPEIYNQ